VALAYVAREYAEETAFVVKTARAGLEATRSELPFFKGGTARKKLED
jgi:aminomethyltransferase